MPSFPEPTHRAENCKVSILCTVGQSSLSSSFCSSVQLLGLLIEIEVVHV